VAEVDKWHVDINVARSLRLDQILLIKGIRLRGGSGEVVVRVSDGNEALIISSRGPNGSRSYRDGVGRQREAILKDQLLRIFLLFFCQQLVKGSRWRATIFAKVVLKNQLKRLLLVLLHRRFSSSQIFLLVVC
jgi:hypothetical protein